MFYLFMNAVPQTVLVYASLMRAYTGIKQVQFVPVIDEALYTMSTCCWFGLITAIKLELWFATTKLPKMFNKLMAVERQLIVSRNRLWIFQVKLEVYFKK